MPNERGQASIEWVALVSVLAIAFGGLLTAVPTVDGRSLGGALAHRFGCLVGGGCDDGDDELARAYGIRDAELVRRHLQGLVFEPGERQVPVDWRSCRAVECATVPDDRDLDAHRSAAGLPVTVFTRLLRRGERRYVQYWFYYPDSNTTWAASDEIWEHTPVGAIGGLVTGSDRYPGYHRDDWEGAIVRVEADGRAAVRVTSHGHWQWCKQDRCADSWGPVTGWTRVSRGSHAGHVPVDAHVAAACANARPAPTRFASCPWRASTGTPIAGSIPASCPRGRRTHTKIPIPPSPERVPFEGEAGYRKRGTPAMARTVREQQDKRREEKLKQVKEQVEEGSLVIRKMTTAERKANPPRPPREKKKR